MISERLIPHLVDPSQIPENEYLSYRLLWPQYGIQAEHAQKLLDAALLLKDDKEFARQFRHLRSEYRSRCFRLCEICRVADGMEVSYLSYRGFCTAATPSEREVATWIAWQRELNETPDSFVECRIGLYAATSVYYQMSAEQFLQCLAKHRAEKRRQWSILSYECKTTWRDEDGRIFSDYQV